MARRKKRPYTATKEEWSELSTQLHETTKEEWEAIVQRIHTPTEEDWDEAIDNIKRTSYLDSAAFREKADKFALTLERMGCRAHRDADRLEVLSYFRWKAKDVRVSEYSRSAIKTELERWYDDERYFHFVDFLFDQLVETGLRMHKQLRQQAATILDVAEHVYEELAAHERLIEEIKRKRRKQRTRDGRRTRNGAPPTRKVMAIVSLMITWDVDPKEMSEQLRRRGIRMKPKTLSVYRWRRMTGK